MLKRIQDSKAQVDYVNCAMYDPDQPGHIEKTVLFNIYIYEYNLNRHLYPIHTYIEQYRKYKLTTYCCNG